ncbi:MAG: undecaprenyl-phosphate galactose phosphotransferase [Chthonomonadaceae bacterium]|nr:undecaprenyl-phosphate galactose phosphotransferase [Chthonomonadaceae bacterium]
MVQGELPASARTRHSTGMVASKEGTDCVVSSLPTTHVTDTIVETPLAPISKISEAAGLDERKVGPAYLVLKRCLDLVLTGCLLILIMPLLVMIAIVIVIDNPGPILFSQIRVGRNNKPFRFYKFRSMVKNAPALQAQLKTENEAEGPIFKMRRDPRVTRVGRILRKYSLDELPQLVHVLRGEMSLVGPRPHLPSEVAQYAEHQRRRLTVQPGLVCLREIHGRSELTFERWIELDLQYIASRSLWTDLNILLRLVPAVLCGRGAY